MGQSRKRSGQIPYDKRNAGYTGRNRSEYIYGNTVRKLEPERRREEPAVKASKHEIRRNRDKAKYMNAGYLVFLAAALCASAFILVNYIQLRAELTNLTKSVAAKESELNVLKVSNDEEYNRIISSIDLEEIKRIALTELGMVYAGEEQIVQYENKSVDYMRQVTGSNQQR